MRTRRLLFTFSCALLLSNLLRAQTIPNAGFESWHTVGGWYDNPDDWNTNNNSIMAPGVVRDSNAYAGVLAMRVEYLSGLPGYAHTGFLLAQHPEGLLLFAKSNVVSPDTNTISIHAWYQGMPVDSGLWQNTVSISNWSSVVVPLSQNSTSIDSFEIAVHAGSQAGSWISVDTLTLDFGLGGMDEPAVTNWSLYPNPMTDYSQLLFENPSHASCTFVLYNASGQVVREQSGITGTQVSIAKADLASGLYAFRLYCEGKIPVHGKLSVR